MICFELCCWRQLCGDQCIRRSVLQPSQQRAVMLLSYRNKRCPARPMYQFMHVHICRFYRKTNQIPKNPTTICHSTAKHQFIQDLFAASHHSCSPGWPLGRPLLKACEPSCSFILLGHLWQDMSKGSNFYLLITFSLFSDPEGEKNFSLINVVLQGYFNQQS